MTTMGPVHTFREPLRLDQMVYCIPLTSKQVDEPHKQSVLDHCAKLFLANFTESVRHGQSVAARFEHTLSDLGCIVFLPPKRLNESYGLQQTG